jgi:hypothetical protein
MKTEVILSPLTGLENYFCLPSFPMAPAMGHNLSALTGLGKRRPEY